MIQLFPFPKQPKKEMATLHQSINLLATGNSYFFKLGLQSLQSRAEPKTPDYCFFHDLIVNPYPYKGRDTLENIEREDFPQGELGYTNPKTSLYLCKRHHPSLNFDKYPQYLMKRMAYRKTNTADQWGRTIYNDTQTKNYDQVATQFHCLNILKGSHRIVQLKSFLHENIKSQEDKRFFYHHLKLPDRRSKDIKNICLVLEEMNGGSLREQTEKNVQNKNPFTQEQIIQYTCQIAEGLLQLRSKGIIHRDLRPDNVLIHNGQIKFADFDSAFIKGYSDFRNIKNGVDMKDTTPLQLMLLIAQSQQNLKKMSNQELFVRQEKADIYFLGINIYTMVFSQMFQSFNGGKVLQNLINIKKRSGFCPQLLDLMAKCLEKDYHTRADLNQVVKILSQIEKEFYLNSSNYKRIYLGIQPLHLESFSLSKIENSLKQDMKTNNDNDTHNRQELDNYIAKVIQESTLQRNTHLYESFFKKMIRQNGSESPWIQNPKAKLMKLNQANLFHQIQNFLQRLQIKTYYYQLTYRILCQVNLACVNSFLHFQNLKTHIELFSSELVVVLTFLYQTILKCPFTTDPNYEQQNSNYEIRKITENVRTLYIRLEFFSGRLRLQKQSNKNKTSLKTQIQELKRSKEEQEHKQLYLLEESLKIQFEGLKVFQSLLDIANSLQLAEYDTPEERFSFQNEEKNIMRSLQKIETVVKKEMIQTIISLILAYEEIKTQQWGHRSNLKNTIFMLMILEAQNTKTIQKNDIVIIKQQLSTMVNLKLCWKSEELQAFFNNYTETHTDEVIRGIGELESQAVLANAETSSNDKEEEESEQLENKDQIFIHINHSSKKCQNLVQNQQKEKEEMSIDEGQNSQAEKEQKNHEMSDNIVESFHEVVELLPADEISVPKDHGSHLDPIQSKSKTQQSHKNHTLCLEMGQPGENLEQIKLS